MRTPHLLQKTSCLSCLTAASEPSNQDPRLDIQRGIIPHITREALNMLKSEFWSHVDIKEPHECWLWKSKLSDKGYGRVRLEGHKKRAHRVAYELHYQTIDPELDVLHHCDTPACCNPHHLFQGTHQDNMTDRRLKGRYHHKLTEDQISYILGHTEKLNRELAELYEVDHSTIGKIRRGLTHNFDAREPQPKRNTKLSSDQILEIRASTKRGRELSVRYGVSVSAISQIRLGKLRKSV